MRLRFRRTPYAVVGVDADRAKGESFPYDTFLDWLRSEGISPEEARRCEVYRGLRPYAVVTMYRKNDDGSKVLDRTAFRFVTYTKRVTLSSLPPSREV